MRQEISQTPSPSNPPWLDEALERLFARVEERTGSAVEVREQPELEESVCLVPAAAADPVHRILFRDEGNDATAYLVAMEAAQLLRLQQVPPAQRLEMQPQRLARERVVSETERRNRDLGLAQQRQLGLNLYSMTLSQLRTVPAAMAVDLWLQEQLPELRGRQAACLRQQCWELEEGLALGMDRRMPPLVLQANRAMDAAYALHASGLMGLPELAGPYRGGPWEAPGRELLDQAAAAAAAARDEDTDPDRAAIDAWAATLGISRWYRWVPAAAQQA
mgnify:CR=1 FL=1